jgi:hypothetical protein
MPRIELTLDHANMHPPYFETLASNKIKNFTHVHPLERMEESNHRIFQGRTIIVLQVA